MNGSNNNISHAIEDKYIQRILKQEASNIFSAQERILNKFNSSSKKTILEKRSFLISGTSLVISHSKLQRFIDMKNVRGRQRKPIPNHNAVIYGHLNSIINRISFGLTDDVRELISNDYNLELYG